MVKKTVQKNKWSKWTFKLTALIVFLLAIFVFYQPAAIEMKVFIWVLLFVALVYSYVVHYRQTGR